MEEKMTATVPTVEIERKKEGAAGMIRRVFTFVIGVFGLLLSVVLMITIIGIIPGVFVMTSSLFFIAISLGFQDVKCPSCAKKQTIAKRAEDFECKRCKQSFIIDWK